ncbi:hypothetical protein P4N68_00935 [Corynebacterium felinum]|uniref:Sugar phosphate permease n=1 Tax=Corynebacterium felinum TaxID=131318 RepID=A0ABU2B8S6_9CORY|nr:MFS transporter [Corynebacterium felinum]MDF5819645.1 hypothetical protein [Corynebacterium felinum]MDR7355040.1 sugar phosphate permease [Corynebacterium felinum]
MTPQKILASAQFISACGAGLNLSGFALFFVTVRGFSSTDIGLGLGLAGLLGFFAAVPLSAPADSMSPVTLYVRLSLISGMTVVALSFVHAWWLFVLLAGLQAGLRQAMGAVMLVIVGDLLTSEQRTVFMAKLRVLRNVGFSIGAVVASFILVAQSAEVRQLLVAVPGLALIASVPLLACLPRTSSHSTEVKAVGAGLLSSLRAIRSGAYVGLAFVTVPLMLFNGLLILAIPMTVDKVNSIPTWVAPSFFIVNTVLVVVVQTRVAHWSTTVLSAARCLMAAAVFLVCALVGISVVLFIPAPSFPTAAGLLLLTVVFITASEVLFSAALWELSYSLAPESSRSAHLGVFGATGSLQDVVAAPVIGALLAAPTVLSFGVVELAVVCCAVGAWWCIATLMRTQTQRPSSL